MTFHKADALWQNSRHLLFGESEQHDTADAELIDCTKLSFHDLPVTRWVKQDNQTVQCSHSKNQMNTSGMGGFARAINLMDLTWHEEALTKDIKESHAKIKKP